MTTRKPARSAARPHTSRRRLVMVVDGSRAQRRLLAICLDRAGYDTLEAATGDEALASFHRHRPDFILSDWMLETMSGPALCARIRALDDENAYTYFILLTLKAEPEDIAYGLENGADDFLAKPASAAELLGRLRAGERILQLQDQARQANRKLTETLGALNAAKAAMDRDLNDARRLQQGLIGERQAHFGPFSVANILRSAGAIGGDLTGSFAINARRFGVFAIDVSGHGVAAALLTARLATQFSTSVDQNAALFISEFGLYESRAPADLARYLNHLMLTDLHTDSYFTMVYAVIDHISGEVRMVQAGHPHPIVQRADGSFEVIGNGGLPIGMIEGAAYEEITLQLNPGERLLIASAGLWDAADSTGRPLGEEGLCAIMQTNRA
ncbi:MAG: fused response regulator/phosphatase, partial [Paracoccus sp. (in: a-proteobacteria)]|nr:fused response regulator/phosphatase [Paracoccus sp. (in: a-proteobacteria)]